MLGTVDASTVDTMVYALGGGFLCMLSWLVLLVSFCVIMISSGKWDVREQKEVLLDNVGQREKEEALYREAGYHVITRYFDQERGNKLCIVFEKRTIKLFKGII